MNQNKTWLFAWNSGSKSAKLLASKLGIKRIKLMGSKYRGRPDHTVINWGSSDLPPHVRSAGTIFNPPEFVGVISTKRLTFQMLHDAGIPTIEWTTDSAVADGWLDDGFLVVGRHTERGHGGRGIVLFDSLEDTTVEKGLPLYTKYFPKKSEWRLHVASDGELFYVQRKVLQRGIDPKRDYVNWRVRNMANGFIFQRYNNVVPHKVLDLGYTLAEFLRDTGHKAIINADVLYNEKRDEAVVCELNSAPGLDETSAETYANKIKELV